MDKKVITAYVCNGGANCHSYNCKILFPKIGYCCHTFKPEFAKNPLCEDPWNHPERFELVRKNTYAICYEEKEVSDGSPDLYTKRGSKSGD